MNLSVRISTALQPLTLNIILLSSAQMTRPATVGLIEEITILKNGQTRKLSARVDTGAKSNSIDKRLAEDLGILPGSLTTVVKSAMGRAVRHVVHLDIEISGKKMTGRFTLADRSHLKYQVLIGRDILKKGFIIDPSK